MALRGALKHRKTRKLARLLGIPPCFALGILEAMWHVTAALFPSGSIGRMSNEEIADQIDYTGDAHALVAALVEAALLDEHALHRLIVHDWHVHSDNTLDATLYRKGLRYANGSIPRGTKLAAAEKAQLTDRFYRRPADSLFDMPETQPDVTVPSTETIPGVNVLPIDGHRGESAPAPDVGIAAEAPALDGAAKRLPEPVPGPVPEPAPAPGPTTPTPPPSRRGSWRDLQQRIAEERATSVGAVLDAAAQHVLERCSFTGMQAVALHTSVWCAIEAECKRVDKPPGEHAMAVAEVMADNYAEYVSCGDLLRYRWKPRTFFEAGHWRNWKAWPIDRKDADRQSQAKLGSYVN